MRNWFASPLRETEYETFSARVLHYTLLLLLGIILIFLPTATSNVQLTFIPALFLLLSLCYVLLHLGRLRLASLLFLVGLWLVITAAAYGLNGIRNASISGYAIVIILAAVLVADYGAIAFTGLSILSVLILALGELQGVLPLNTSPLYLADRVFQQIALFGTAGILLVAAVRVILANDRRLRENEQTLRHRNEELEIQITERLRTEANLRISEEKYRILFENTPIMAGVYGRDGEIVLLNKLAAERMGGTPESLHGRNLRDVLDAAVAEQGIQDHASVMTQGKPMVVENQVQLRTGELYYMRHIVPLPSLDGGEPSQVLVLTTDLTQKVMAEQRERELARANERHTFLMDFFSTVSHDLKTPLTVLNTSLYLLEKANTEEQRDEKLARMAEQVALMDQYIQDMLTISRLEYVPTFNFEMLHLNPLVEEVIDLLRPRIESKQLRCHITAQPDLPAVRGNQEQLLRMLTNLIENAINYTANEGEILIETALRKGQVVVAITDSGIGIEPEAVPYIFDRFYRTSSARLSTRSGTGLGLAIVKKIAEMHRASIEVNSRVGKGTTFCVFFPTEPLS